MDNREEKLDPNATDGGLSRREWLLKLGSTIALAGFRGIPDPPGQDFSSAGPLPPGLFSPALDHLHHAMTSEGIFFPAPAGSETEYTRPRSGPFVPQALSPEEFRLVQRLVAILLGEDIAMAAEQGSSVDRNIYEEVAEWIDLVIASAAGTRAAAQRLAPEHRALAVAYFGDAQPVRELETFEPERVCKEGFAWFAQESRRRYGKDFLATEFSSQIELVRSVSDAREDPSTINPGTRLCDFLKAECIRGFYTSRIGLKELSYTGNSFYGQPPGCELGAQS